MKRDKVPERTCIMCRSKKDKRDLIRIVRDKTGKVFYDPTGKANGRGAYVCRDEKCINKFLKKNSLERAFKKPVNENDIQLVRDSVMEIL